MIMTNTTLPTLYSYRRCPYAIRARTALVAAGIRVKLHEISFRDKPQAMLDASPKGTVPVLCVDGAVIDESLDIMLWALDRHDPLDWYRSHSETDQKAALALIKDNDENFKEWLDKYKYSDRHPEHSQEHYRQQCEVFLTTLETQLQQHTHLLADNPTLADMAMFPFIRQFSMVEGKWFAQCDYPKVRLWLNEILESELFKTVIKKYPEDAMPIIWPAE